MAGLAILFGVSILLVVAIYVVAVASEVLRPPRANAAWALSRGRPTQPSDLGLDCTEWIHATSGADLPVWEIDLAVGPPDSNQPEGPSVVLVHGWGRSRVDMLSRLPPFLDDAARVYLVDLRGHGEASGRTRLGAGEGDDLASLIDRLPNGPIVLVGHSMGANACLHAAAQRPARVAGVVAIAPYDTLATPLRARLALRELPSGGLARLVLGLLGLVAGRAEPTIQVARRVRCPVLVLQGGLDRVSPLGEASAIAESAGGELLVLPEAEHADHELREPLRFAEACRDFVRNAVDGWNGRENDRRAALQPPA